ncbi:CoB--CoM heterodisulfide reductase iron-sulfur subunit A family protein [candidate division WOR-3 bacterium]|nr:CoB--CoM heterodisulfide reductase iron-sulfur subunit A family protein [candidate division WOR-3 bacterium]
MVIGGGIAGVQAALDLADSGIEVFLVERSPSIGGRMAQLDKTFPTNDCSLCILSPKLVEAGNHPYITIITNAEVEQVSGEAPYFKVAVRKYPRYVDEDRCTGCGVCMTKCPIKIPDQYNMSLMDTKCIHIPFPQAVPAVALIDAEHCLYLNKGKCRNCERVCEPKAIDFDQKEETVMLEVGSIIVAAGLGEYNALHQDEYAYKTCPNVVTSMEFERMLSASGPTRGHVLRPSDRREPRRVAFIQCVGSRDERSGNEYCSAICCMQAAKDAIIITEHMPDVAITVFSMDIRACGKNFDAFIDRAEQEHNTRFVRARVSTVDVDPVNDDPIVQYAINGRTIKDRFDLLILSVGLVSTPVLHRLCDTLGIAINDFGFVVTSDFKPVGTSRPGIFVCGTISGPKDIPESVIEASGAASSAGALLKDFESNKIVVEYPPMRDINEGDRPNVGVFVCHCGINIAATVDVKKVVEEIAKEPYVVHCQDLMFACSQDAQKLIIDAIHEHDLNRIVVAACTPRTHEPLFQETLRKAGLNQFLFDFANIRDQCSWVHQQEPEQATAKAIDLVRMSIAKVVYQEPLSKTPLGVSKQALVIGGGISGMIAALDIADHGYHVHLVEKEKALGGNLRYIQYTLDGKETAPVLQDIINLVSTHPQITVYMSSKISKTSGYIGNFLTTVQCISKDIAEDSMLSNGDETIQEIEHGVIVVATGAYEHIPKEYCYGQDPRIITQRELEQKIASNDPSLPAVKKVVMINCVGSRDDNHPYCSRICCSMAIKNALLLKKMIPNVAIFNFYRDVRSYGLKELFYKKARQAGIVFIQYDAAEKPRVEINGNGLLVTGREKVLDRSIYFNPDLLVLSTGVVPNGDNKRLSQALKVPLGIDGFFFEAHVKLRPVDFATDGIFVCGLAHYPKDIRETIAQAKAAASRAVTVLSKDMLEAEGKIASVRADRCSGCGLCVAVCAYRAIELDAEKNVAVVNEVLCKGCGTCAASCRSGAIDLKGFRDTQILAALSVAS